MPKQDKMQETEIAEIARRFFSQKGYKLYPEVTTDIFPGRPDWVAVKETICAVVECKSSLSYGVIEQLARWPIYVGAMQDSEYVRNKDKYGIPHLLIAFTGEGGSSRMADLKEEILKQYRIGYYVVKREPCDFEWYKRSSYRRGIKEGDFHSMCDTIHECFLDGFRYTVTERMSPRIQPGSRHTAHNIISQLNDDMMIGQAGAAGGQGTYMTPFKRTMVKVRDILAKGGEYHISEIITRLNNDFGGHHYSSDSSATSSLPALIEKLEVGVRSETPPYRFTLHENGNKFCAPVNEKVGKKKPKAKAKPKTKKESK
tara:strand:+ start:2005 stop:2946 length:942 start_codon:yes stop_codon:yes gene_type:complete